MMPPAIAGRFGPDLTVWSDELVLEADGCEPEEVAEVGARVADGDPLEAVELNDGVPVGTDTGV